MGLLDRLRRLLGLDPVAVPPPPRPRPAPGGVPAEGLAAYNARRAERRLAPFARDVRLQAAAQAHANHMATVGRMAHDGIGDGDIVSRLHGAGYAFLSARENVAWNQRSVAEVVTDWMASSGHRAGIVGDFQAAALAVAYGTNGDAYWCGAYALPAIIAAATPGASPIYSVGAPHVTATPTTAASSVEVLAG